MEALRFVAEIFSDWFHRSPLTLIAVVVLIASIWAFRQVESGPPHFYAGLVVLIVASVVFLGYRVHHQRQLDDISWSHRMAAGAVVDAYEQELANDAFGQTEGYLGDPRWYGMRVERLSGSVPDEGYCTGTHPSMYNASFTDAGFRRNEYCVFYDQYYNDDGRWSDYTFFSDLIAELNETSDGVCSAQAELAHQWNEINGDLEVLQHAHWEIDAYHAASPQDIDHQVESWRASLDSFAEVYGPPPELRGMQ